MPCLPDKASNFLRVRSPRPLASAACSSNSCQRPQFSLMFASDPTDNPRPSDGGGPDATQRALCVLPAPCRHPLCFMRSSAVETCRGFILRAAAMSRHRHPGFFLT
jgi:hypothetical protein